MTVGSLEVIFSGLHRYIFLVYNQTGRIGVNEEPIPRGREEGRYHWNVTEFVEQNNLGNPIAGNFFQAEFVSEVESA